MTSLALEMTSFRNYNGIGNLITLSSSSSHFWPQFKIPSKIPQISYFVAQAIKAKSATTPPRSPSMNALLPFMYSYMSCTTAYAFSGNVIGLLLNFFLYGNGGTVCNLSNSLGRRQLMYMSTIPFLIPPGIAVSSTSDLLHVKEEIRNVLSKGKAAGVLRLVFHDAGTFDINEKTGGMNGSIVNELDRPENKGLKKSVKILEKAKAQIEVQCPVSWADVIAVAGAEAVSICEGPTISVQLGRMDSLVPDPEGKLPEESLDAPALKQCFQNKGFSVQELVALSGAHTLGGKGFGNPTVFDNSYFKILLEKPWLSSAGMSSMIGLPSDRALADDDECLRWISKYADNQELFFDDFKNVYIKLVNTGAKWRTI
ncbi:OLC1v1032845C1 [Oldenlandia corymbosa var. corymbosa]|uniref:OLC1v1032845C1 n=1 Tax=Oldenlandia corymbosa var. corymbosa TaxID=529605 RepID=A0AAV1CMQ4_OLDCO|nr:OLC1v1032845C1 [Oldenlandia corymbosa var. corymbosa]